MIKIRTCTSFIYFYSFLSSFLDNVNFYVGFKDDHDGGGMRSPGGDRKKEIPSGSFNKTPSKKSKTRLTKNSDDQQKDQNFKIS